MASRRFVGRFLSCVLLVAAAHACRDDGADERGREGGGAGASNPDADDGNVDGGRTSAGASGAFASAGSENGASGSDAAAGALNTPENAIENGRATVTQAARSSFAALLAVDDGERTYVVESRRDIEPGPLALPWRSRFRLAAYDQGALAWSFDANVDDVIADVVVHPSGDVTLSLERHEPPRSAYDLRRLSRAGKLLATTTLGAPLTTPVTDYGAKDPRPLFAMKSALGDATTAGWVRLLADGENVVVGFLSFAATPNDEPLSSRLALGLEAMSFASDGYVERWARVVEGAHLANPTAWAYDDFRWNDQAVRPFLARDDATGDILVGRAWNKSRCQANVAAFAEFTNAECLSRAPMAEENELLPLAVTRFDAQGVRHGTVVLEPDDDAAEQVAFGIAARGRELAVVGAVVRQRADGGKKTYPDPEGFVDYDGYVALYDAQGKLLRHHDYNLGRGDVLAGMRWLPGGVVAVGATGWDRGQGGMSVSRGADPLFVWFSNDGLNVGARVVPLSDGGRHWNLHDVVTHGASVVGYGFADAPMTHSADNHHDEARTFGSLRIGLE